MRTTKVKRVVAQDALPSGERGRFPPATWPVSPSSGPPAGIWGVATPLVGGVVEWHRDA